jgi:hypothetical protein
MTFRACPRQPEILQLLLSGHWPHAAAPELRNHVAACRTCSDQTLLTQSFQAARTTSTAAANLPPPGVLWWRAQLRRRNAAVERIGKPILGAQIFALAVALILVTGFAVSQAKHGLHWLSWSAEWSTEWLTSLPQSPAFHLETLLPLAFLKPGASLIYLIPALGMVALLSGIVLYLASEKP